MTIKDAEESINIARLNADGGWWVWTGIVEGVEIAVKGYKTWVQRIQSANIKDDSPHDMKVKDFRQWTTKMLGQIVERG